MKKNDTIAAGLNGLLSAPTSTPTPQEQGEQLTQERPKVKGNYKTVCYSIAPELADRVRYIAYWDRKKLNAVVSEALAAYCDSWKPSTPKAPKNV